MMEIRENILPNVLERIGNTPLVRINKIAKEEGVQCEVIAKCEYFNAGGSIKDRIAKRMVEVAEAEGLITPGVTTIIEPTSGNTGIGLAMAAAVKNYSAVITLPEKMSDEKVNLLRGLGAKVLRTPTEAAYDAPDSHISVANQERDRLAPNSWIPDQYSNVNNPLAHAEGTGPEIWRDCGHRVDVVVMGAGTGGTISGVASYLKRVHPGIRIYGVDPKGSILNKESGVTGEPYMVEGIGYDFIPKVLDYENIDGWVVTEDRESMLMCRRLIREEGLLCGGSSGAAMAGAMRLARQLNLGPEQRMVVILPDSIRNYMSKALSDNWMLIHGFLDAKDYEPSSDPWNGLDLASLMSSLRRIPILRQDMTVKEYLVIRDHADNNDLIALEKGRKIVGVVHKQKVNIRLLSLRDRSEREKQLNGNLIRQAEKEFVILPAEGTPINHAAVYLSTGYPVLVFANNDLYNLYRLDPATLIEDIMI